MTALIAAAALFGTITGKIASAKGRFGLLWALYGTVLFPIAIPHVLLIRRALKCPFCRRSLKNTHRCTRCGRDLPLVPTDKLMNANLGETVGIRLGDSIRRARRRLARSGWQYEFDESENGGLARIVCAPWDIHGHSADVTVEASQGRICAISIGYASDPDFQFYYNLRKMLVAQYGTPNYENFENDYSDHWVSKKFLATLSTRRPEDAPAQYATTLVYIAMEGTVSEAVKRYGGRNKKPIAQDPPDAI